MAVLKFSPKGLACALSNLSTWAALREWSMDEIRVGAAMDEARREVGGQHAEPNSLAVRRMVEGR